jgi:hypothetical protein
MEKEITFRTEIEFKGSLKQFEQVAATLVKLPIRIRVEWPPEHNAGCWPVPIENILSKQILDAIVEGIEPLKVIKPFPGGIRDPHLHVGGKIVLINRDKFREVVGKAAMEIAGKIAEMSEYPQAIGAIRNLVNQCEAIPINLP